MLKLSHTVLYAKNWYKKRHIVQDVIRTLEADGYNPQNSEDCARILMARLEEHNLITDSRMMMCLNINQFRNEETTFNHAVILYCLQIMTWLEKDKWEVKAPDYKNVLPRRNGIKDKTIKEFFEA